MHIGEQHANVLTALGRRDPQELLDGEREGMLLVHRRHVVQPVEVRDRLQVGLVLDQLLGAAVKQPDMRIDPFDYFAVKFEDEAENAVGRGMLGSEIDRVVIDLLIAGIANVAEFVAKLFALADCANIDRNRATGRMNLGAAIAHAAPPPGRRRAGPLGFGSGPFATLLTSS